MEYHSSNTHYMKLIFSQFSLVLLSSSLLLSCAALKAPAPADTNSIQAEIDLISIVDDKVKITITPPAIKAASTVFYIPQIVPGTYEYSNFGRFIENFEALDKKGNPLEVIALDQNSWEILNPKKLAQIRYLANDTFDGPQGQEIYPMGGTDFQQDKVFLLNLHSMVGYFEDMKERSYKLSVRSPEAFKPFTSLPISSTSDTLDVFNAERYFHIIDNPILYSKPNAVSFDLDDIKVGLAVYSPTETHQATAYQPAIEEMMKAQKAFLGDANDTPSYDILLGNEIIYIFIAVIFRFRYQSYKLIYFSSTTFINKYFCYIAVFRRFIFHSGLISLYFKKYFST